MKQQGVSKWTRKLGMLLLMFEVGILLYSSLCYAWGSIPGKKPASVPNDSHEWFTYLALFSEDPLIATGVFQTADSPDFLSGNTHGHRITEYLLQHEIEKYTPKVGSATGAEWGAVYWAKRAKEVYLKNKKDKRWMTYLGYATHYMADSLCPAHCDNDDFWGLGLASRSTSFEALLWPLDLGGYVENPHVTDDFPEIRNLSDAEAQNAIRAWIIDKAHLVKNMPVRDAINPYNYLDKDDLKKVFAWIGIGIRGLYKYVTTTTSPISNQKPNAVITEPGTTVLVNVTAALGGQKSYDPDGDPLTFRWTLIQRPSGSRASLSNANTATPSFKPDKAGDYVLQLTVTDEAGAKSSAQVTLRAVALGLVAGTSSPGKVYAYRGGSTWEPISGELGFAVLDIIVYNGALYAGAMSSSSRYESVGRLYRYDGGPNWTLVGDNLDNQVSCLVVYKGKLYIGTSWNGGRLYRYDGPGRCVLVVDHRDPGNWRGFRSAYVWGDYLYLGDISYDIIGRYDGTKFEHIVHLGGSCIYDFVLYSNNLYAGAWYGSLYRSLNGTTWEKVTATGLEGSHLWELEVFKYRLFMGFDSGKLQSFDGRNVQTVWTAPTSIISMVTDGTQLYLGTGGEAGYRSSTSGEGRVYVYNGKSVTSISDRLGVGVQVLYLASSGAKTSPAELDQIGEPSCSLTVKSVPNPIRDVHSTTFIVEGVNAELIRVEVYDLTGKLVWQGEGSGNELTWHTEDLTGLPLANGVYLYKVLVKVGETWIASDVQKLVILR